VMTSPDVAPTTGSRIDPILGFWINVAWLAGMLLVTPLYHPYSRLLFPLMTAVWLAAAGAVSWWLEVNINAGVSMEGGFRELSPLERIAGRITRGTGTGVTGFLSCHGTCRVSANSSDRLRCKSRPTALF
ncbi:MAG: hypothetical protein WCK86_16760, partial [Planctomycetia bacterium]